MTRWAAERAVEWSRERTWVCGFNFLPSSAVNFLEMWYAERFDRATIERELGWAAGIGFNAIRVNLHYLIWQHDRDGLFERFDWLLSTATANGMTTVPCLFDDCGFGGAEPAYGPQQDPIPGVHNSRAVASPGREALMDRNAWPDYERYLRDVISNHRSDPRVLFWDLYNEPGNRLVFGSATSTLFDEAMLTHSEALIEACFDWARDVQPVQPLTVGAWVTPPADSLDDPYQNRIDQLALALSDIVSFHAYASRKHVARYVDYLARSGRPLFCTEWMARGVDSRIRDQLELFHDQRIGCFQWGLVEGRSQTWLPWPEDILRHHGAADNESAWFHELLRADGRPYDPEEVVTIRQLTARARAMTESPRENASEDSS